MTEFQHGGDLYTIMEKGGRTEGELLDFSANINPLGMPERVRDAAASALSFCDHYPDPKCRALARALAEKERIPQEYLVFGNGAADLIFRIAAALRPQTALVTAPAFSEYENALKSVQCQVLHYALEKEKDFQLDEAFLACLDEPLDMVFLCNPNNPTGQLIPPDLLERIAEKCEEKEIFLVVDECFIDFVKEPQVCTVKDLLFQCRYLFVLRAFTKNYGMAGLRLGYGMCARPDVLRLMREAGPPWNVSLVAQKAGIQALREDDYLQKARDLIFVQREKLRQQLISLGYWVLEPAANYLFFRLRQMEDPAYVDEFTSDLLEDGILIRDCSNYEGIGRGYFRIAVKTEEENQRLVEALIRRERRWQKQL